MNSKASQQKREGSSCKGKTKKKEFNLKNFDLVNTVSAWICGSVNCIFYLILVVLSSPSGLGLLIAVWCKWQGIDLNLYNYKFLYIVAFNIIVVTILLSVSVLFGIYDEAIALEWKIAIISCLVALAFLLVMEEFIESNSKQEETDHVKKSIETDRIPDEASSLLKFAALARPEQPEAPDQLESAALGSALPNKSDSMDKYEDFLFEKLLGVDSGDALNGSQYDFVVVHYFLISITFAACATYFVDGIVQLRDEKTTYTNVYQFFVVLFVGCYGAYQTICRVARWFCKGYKKFLGQEAEEKE